MPQQLYIDEQKKLFDVTLLDEGSKSWESRFNLFPRYWDQIQFRLISKGCNFWIIHWIPYFIACSHYNILGTSFLIFVPKQRELIVVLRESEKLRTCGAGTDMGKHHNDCECCPVLLFNVRSLWLSWLGVLNCLKCLHVHKSSLVRIVICQYCQKD